MKDVYIVHSFKMCEKLVTEVPGASINVVSGPFATFELQHNGELVFKNSDAHMFYEMVAAFVAGHNRTPLKRNVMPESITITFPDAIHQNNDPAQVSEEIKCTSCGKNLTGCDHVPLCIECTATNAFYKRFIVEID